MSRFRITVDQAAIQRGGPAIHVHDAQTDRRESLCGPLQLVNAVIVQGMPQQDGARVWIDADDFIPARGQGQLNC